MGLHKWRRPCGPESYVAFAVRYEDLAENALAGNKKENLLIPRLDSIIREHGKARLLLNMGDYFHGWEAAALWDDTRLMGLRMRF